MQLQRQAFFAASMRVLFGVLALSTFHDVFPQLEDYRWLLLGYTGMALVAMVLVWFNVGGRFRAYLLGIIDMLLLSLLIHLVGPSHSVLVSAYFLLAILNALVVSAGFGLFMAIAGSATYGFMLLIDMLRYPIGLPPPDRWVTEAPLSSGAAFFAWMFVSVMLGGSTLVVANLVRRVEEDEARLQRLSKHDPLTGLFNRRHLLECLDRELARVKRGRSLATLMIDLDRFKRINDTYGHAQGDRLLKRLADTLRESTRETDVPGRWGGDEFVVLLPDTEADEAQRVAARLTERIRATSEQFDAEAVVTASIGLSTAQPSDGPNAIIDRADARAYDAKQQGGDRVVVASRREEATMRTR